MRKEWSYLHNKNFCPSYQVGITNIVCAWVDFDRWDAIHLFLIHWTLDTVEGIKSFTKWEKLYKLNPS